MSLALIAVCPFAAVLLLAGLSSGPSRSWQAVAIAGQLPPLGLLLAAAPAILQTGPLVSTQQWLPFLGLNLALRLDGPALLGGLSLMTVNLLVPFYLNRQSGPSGPDRTGASICLLMNAALFSCILSDNILQLLIFWEVGAYCATLLVIGGAGLSRLGTGLFAGLATGSIALIVGFGLLAQITRSTDLAEIVQAGSLSAAGPGGRAILPLLLVACLTRCAPLASFGRQWGMLPRPALLLATTVLAQSGLFVLVRLWPPLHPAPAWSVATAFLGLSILILGAASAFRVADRITKCAWLTIGQLGLSVLILSVAPDPRLALIPAAMALVAQVLLLLQTIVAPDRGFLGLATSPVLSPPLPEPPFPFSRFQRAAELAQAAQNAAPDLWQGLRRPVLRLGLPLATGTAAAVFAFVTLSASPPVPPVSQAYAALAAQLGYANLGPAIGFDIRGIDSFVIIAMLCAAALCWPAASSIRQPSAPPLPQKPPHARTALPLILLAAAAVLLGLPSVLGMGSAVLAGILLGTAQSARRPYPARQPLHLITAGLLVAGLTGAGSWLFARPFLTSGFVMVPTPNGAVRLASSLGLQVGLVLAVAGSTAMLYKSIRFSAGRG